MTPALPSSIRYVKNGSGGRWWKVAKSSQQLHAGWDDVPDDLLKSGDLAKIGPLLEANWGGKQGGTQDFNALCTLLDSPSQHIWITFQDDCLCGAPSSTAST